MATTADPKPMPPRFGWMMFHTPKQPARSRWPIPSSMRRIGIPSNTNIIRNGKTNAPEKHINNLT